VVSLTESTYVAVTRRLQQSC